MDVRVGAVPNREKILCSRAAKRLLCRLSRICDTCPAWRLDGRSHPSPSEPTRGSFPPTLGSFSPTCGSFPVSTRRAAAAPPAARSRRRRGVGRQAPSSSGLLNKRPPPAAAHPPESIRSKPSPPDAAHPPEPVRSRPLPPAEPAAAADAVLDLLLASSDLAGIVSQIDELISDALQCQTMSTRGKQDIELLSIFLSNTNACLKQ